MRWSVAALILVAGLAAAQDGGYQDPGATACWNCHSPDRDDNPMMPAFTVDPGTTALSGDAALRPRIVNTWDAEVSAMSLEIDLTEAPGVSFISGQEPYNNSTRGAVQIGLESPLFALQQHHAEHAVHVPAGATALRIQVVPDDATTIGPDFVVSLTDALSTRPFATIDEAGPGRTEAWTLRDASAIAAHGAGDWRVDVALQPAGTDGHLDPGFRSAGFEITVDAWFNASLERIMVLDAPGPVMPGNAQPFHAPLVVEHVAPGQAITFTARARVFYEHGDNTPDEALLQYRHRIVIGADADGTPTLGTQAFLAPIPREVLGLDSIAEAIGYGAAFLLVASVLSGGILGKGSRRAMNRLFTTARRRVAFHNFLSYGILAAAFAHLILFLVEVAWHWAWGLLWGGAGILCLFALGFTGALQVPIIRRWGFASWRWMHFGFAIAAILFTVIHILLDGSHFTVRDAIGWTDPLVPDSRQAA